MLWYIFKNLQFLNVLPRVNKWKPNFPAWIVRLPSSGKNQICPRRIEGWRKKTENGAHQSNFLPLQKWHRTYYAGPFCFEGKIELVKRLIRFVNQFPEMWRPIQDKIIIWEKVSFSEACAAHLVRPRQNFGDGEKVRPFCVCVCVCACVVAHLVLL